MFDPECVRHNPYIRRTRQQGIIYCGKYRLPRLCLLFVCKNYVFGITKIGKLGWHASFSNSNEENTSRVYLL